ncbi:hypothetical protein BD410DRAFT_794430 [Rickenella mellea]|uniref:DUF6533 domain-containing protein n=1 Tax=Rickenella mellea TaxID=50990 RepID=A0A4Y7PPH4_9AGAM|nr:hypothetical protein BD410DRAFT_794430 [Rickenella mellea]
MSDGTLAAQAALDSEFHVNNYYWIASFALLYYDYLLTINQEMIFFWRRRITFASGLFFACRYLSLFGNVPVILQTFGYWPPDSSTCHSLQTYHQLFSSGIQSLVAVTLITRTYALYGRSRRILALTCFTWLCAGAIAFWSLTRTPSTDSSPTMSFDSFGCGLSIDTHAAAKRLGVAWVGVVVFDTEILILTVWKTVKLSKFGGGQLVHVLLRDGSIYYAILTAANISQILTFWYASPLLKGVSTTFVTVISVIMISRAMMNLQEPERLKSTGYLDSLPGQGTFDESELCFSEFD